MSARSDNFDFLPSLRRRILRVGGSDGSRKTGRPKPPHRIAHIPEVVDQMLQMTREQLAVEICGAYVVCFHSPVHAGQSAQRCTHPAPPLLPLSLSLSTFGSTPHCHALLVLTHSPPPPLSLSPPL